MKKEQRVIIGMMDGLDMDYLEQIELKAFNRMQREGIFKEVAGVFPSVTNVNNVSIACGAWPKEHGISANSYFDRENNRPEYMNSAELISHPTIFARAKRLGIKSALLTSKRKTLELFKKDVAIGIAAESPTPEIIAKYGQPADIYSCEINYWLWEVAAKILEEQPDIGLLYVHITDYPMHAWGPEKEESKIHLQTIDTLVAKALEIAPDAAFLATADHGMNYKTRCWDLDKVLSAAGVKPLFVLSPERDYYIVHHRNFTGCSWVWLNSLADRERAVEILKQLVGVEDVLEREEVAKRYHLAPEHLGDIIVMGDRDTMFGEMDEEFEELPATYRAHGSLHEMRLPLLLWNYKQDVDQDSFRYNLDLTRNLFR